MADDYGYVVGTFIHPLGSPAPTDRPALGCVTFIPLGIRHLSNPSRTAGRINEPIEIAIDGHVNGWLVTGLYNVKVTFADGTSMPKFPIRVENTHTPSAPLDLNTAQPPIPYPDTIIIVSEAERIRAEQAAQEAEAAADRAEEILDETVMDVSLDGADLSYTRHDGTVVPVGTIEAGLKKYNTRAELDAVSVAEIGSYTGDLTAILGIEIGNGTVLVTSQTIESGIIFQHLIFLHPAVSGVFSRYGALGSPNSWLTDFTAQNFLPSLAAAPDGATVTLTGYRSGTYQVVGWQPVDGTTFNQVNRYSTPRNIASLIELSMTSVGAAIAVGVRDMGIVTINLGKRTWAAPGVVMKFSNQGWQNPFLPRFGGTYSSPASSRVRYFDGRGDDGTIGSRFKLYDDGFYIKLEALTAGTGQNLVFDWPVDQSASSTTWPGIPAT